MNADQTQNFFKSAKPLFILGVPRSGTTFLQQVINLHPEIFVTDELRVVSWVIQEATKLNEGFALHGNPYPFNYGKEFSHYLTHNCGTLISPFYFNQAQKCGKPNIKYWGDKYPHYHEILPKIAAMFPRAFYILIHRDLKSVISSVKKGHQWDIEKSSKYACSIYKQYILSFHELFEKNILSPERLINVSYTSLSLDIENSSEYIFKGLGLNIQDSWKTELLKLRSIQSHSNRKPDQRAIKFNFEKSANRWKTYFSESDISLVIEELNKISFLKEEFSKFINSSFLHESININY